MASGSWKMTVGSGSFLSVSTLSLVFSMVWKCCRGQKKTARSAKVSAFAACCVQVAKPEVEEEEETLRADEVEELAKLSGTLARRVEAAQTKKSLPDP